jgi:Co/Zn/Cd efflux system component
LGYPQRGKFQGFYADVRALALQGLFIYICDHIHLYDPNRATVLAWANYLLSRRCFHEASREFMHTRPKGIDPDCQCLSIDDLDSAIPTPQSPASDYDQLRQLLQADPENHFQTTHVKQHPRGQLSGDRLGAARRPILGHLV